jgi:hypothetical protein
MSLQLLPAMWAVADPAMSRTDNNGLAAEGAGNRPSRTAAARVRRLGFELVPWLRIANPFATVSTLLRRCPYHFRTERASPCLFGLGGYCSYRAALRAQCCLAHHVWGHFQITSTAAAVEANRSHIARREATIEKRATLPEKRPALRTLELLGDRKEKQADWEKKDSTHDDPHWVFLGHESLVLARAACQFAGGSDLCCHGPVSFLNGGSILKRAALGALVVLDEQQKQTEWEKHDGADDDPYWRLLLHVALVSARQAQA